jgi:hypothetical protein
MRFPVLTLAAGFVATVAATSDLSSLAIGLARIPIPKGTPECAVEPLKSGANKAIKQGCRNQQCICGKMPIMEEIAVAIADKCNPIDLRSKCLPVLIGLIVELTGFSSRITRNGKGIVSKCSLDGDASTRRGPRRAQPSARGWRTATSGGRRWTSSKFRCQCRRNHARCQSGRSPRIEHSQRCQGGERNNCLMRPNLGIHLCQCNQLQASGLHRPAQQ